MIRVLLEGMLEELGYTMAAEAGELDEAMTLARQGEFDAAILDVNLHGEPITPVVDILVVSTGYDLRGVPEIYRAKPTLQKPFKIDALAQALAVVAAKPGRA